MSLRICLIIPPSGFLLDERVFPSLGILKVAAALLVARIDVEVLDLSGIENYEEAVRDYLVQHDVDCFGVTATSPQLPAARKICVCIRSERPSARIILGGPHVTLVNSAAKREQKLGKLSRATIALAKLLEFADVLVAGDGEKAIMLALEPSTTRIIDADDRSSAMYLTSRMLEEAEWPERDLIDMSSYHYEIEGLKATSIIAQLGCPFNCGFCGGRLSPSFRNIRTRSADDIVAEMKDLYHRYGIRGFMMQDDELNVNKNMVELMSKIAKAQRDLGTTWRLRGFLKAELITELQAHVMYEAGFRVILVGFESGSPRILENIRKNATLEDNARCIEIAQRNGLKVKALMSIGHPGESHDTVAETASWLKQVRPNDFDLTVITPYPGTPYYDDAVDVGDNVWLYEAKNGDRLYSYDVDFEVVMGYYKGRPGEYSAYVFTDELSSKKIVTLRDKVEDDVRKFLGIPYNTSATAIRYEHSMGQFPPSMLRRSTG